MKTITLKQFFEKNLNLSKREAIDKPNYAGINIEYCENCTFIVKTTGKSLLVVKRDRIFNEWDSTGFLTAESSYTRLSKYQYPNWKKAYEKALSDEKVSFEVNSEQDFVREITSRWYLSFDEMIELIEYVKKLKEIAIDGIINYYQRDYTLIIELTAFDGKLTFIHCLKPIEKQ